MVITFIINKVWLIKIFDNFGTCCVNNMTTITSQDREKFSDKGFADVKQKQFSKSEFFFAKRFYFLNVYPSLIAFLNRLFVDGEYIFDKGVEPPYINRNWLLHGKCGREIERFECIQLINALETVEYVLGEKEKEGALDDEQDGENEN